MPRLFRLTVDELALPGPDRGNALTFTVRLSGAQGEHLRAQPVRIPSGDARWRGLLELDTYLDREKGRFNETEQESGAATQGLLRELGDYLRDEVLSPALVKALYQGTGPGTLFIELPADLPAAALQLTRIPWELVCDEAGRSLPQRGLAVQLVPAGLLPAAGDLSGALALDQAAPPERPLRILLAFAQSRGQAMLAMRETRQRLNDFFLRELAPRFRFELDVLQYGVTREALRRAAGRGEGYDIVHLVAHGEENELILEDDDGRDDPVSGEDLADILGGGFATPPGLVFLTACHSGEVTPAALPAAGGQGGPATAAASEAYTGTAFAMLRAGVAGVVAMRYSVEERFAFDLAEDFYRALFRDGQSPAQALARFRLKAIQQGRQSGYRPHDWATPVLLGGPEAVRPFRLQKGRSPIADRLDVRGELPPALHPAARFVGRGDDLRRLRRHCFDAERADRPLALLWGVGGLGKTALAAEAIDLWHADFEGVLAAQAGAADQALGLDGWLRDLDALVTRRLHLGDFEIWAERAGDPERWLDDRLAALRRCLNTRRLLLVIDNFEPNLIHHGSGYACADPGWTRILAGLAAGLRPGLSVFLLTSRRAPQELLDAPETVLRLPIGPLDEDAGRTFARSAPHFRRLLLGQAPGLDKEQGSALVQRALAVARGHPLILTALESLAERPDDLARRLGEFEAAPSYAGLGQLIGAAATPEEQAHEMAYYEDIAARSLRALIEDRSPAAQRLLRAITLALEAVGDRLIDYVWTDEGFPADMPRLQPPGQDWRAPLQELLNAGLLTPELRTAIGGQENTTYTWHPVVAEQAAAVLPDAAFPAAEYRRRYLMSNLLGYYRNQQPQSRAQAEVALAAARDAVRYTLALGDTTTAVGLINDIHLLSRTLAFRRDLQAWITELLAQVPAGIDRERLQRALADVYTDEGRPQTALPLYREALAGAEARQDWASAGIASHQLGNALGDAQDYPAARAAYRTALRYKRLRGKTISGRLTSLGEWVRLLVIEGGERNLRRAQSHAARLAAIARAYYERVQADPQAAEARAVAAPEDLLIGVLDIQREVEHALLNWAAAVKLCEAKIALKLRHHKGDLAVAEDLFNRATALTRLGELEAAERDLAACQRVFHTHNQPLYESKVLGQLADLADEQGDPARAAQFQTQALAIRHRLGHLSDAAISHNNLGNYLDKQGKTDKALIEDGAALIRALIGEQQYLAQALNNARIYLSKFPAADRPAHWPTAAALFAAYPRLGSLLAERGVDQAAAQAVLDRLWAAVAAEE
jgi:hypothetical protein